MKIAWLLILLGPVVSLAGFAWMQATKACAFTGRETAAQYFGRHMVGWVPADRGPDYETAPDMVTVEDFWSDFSGQGWRKRFFVRRFVRLPICGGRDLAVFYAYSRNPPEDKRS